MSEGGGGGSVGVEVAVMVGGWPVMTLAEVMMRGELWR